MARPAARPTSTPNGVVPVFPLPNAVLFPCTAIPLHVFEPRYREMVRDAMAGDRRLALALLRPGYERDYEGCPAIHGMATLGRIEDFELLPDGRSNFNLVGLERVELNEVISCRSYRLARTTARPEAPVDDGCPRIRKAKLELLAAHRYLMRAVAGSSSCCLSLDESIPFVAAVNAACVTLPAAPAIRQELLEEDDLCCRQRRATAVLDELLEQVLDLRRPRGPWEGSGGEVN